MYVGRGCNGCVCTPGLMEVGYAYQMNDRNILTLHCTSMQAPRGMCLMHCSAALLCWHLNSNSVPATLTENQFYMLADSELTSSAMHVCVLSTNCIYLHSPSALHQFIVARYIKLGC